MTVSEFAAFALLLLLSTAAVDVVRAPSPAEQESVGQPIECGILPIPPSASQNPEDDARQLKILHRLADKAKSDPEKFMLDFLQSSGVVEEPGLDEQGRTRVWVYLAPPPAAASGAVTAEQGSGGGGVSRELKTAMTKNLEKLKWLAKMHLSASTEVKPTYVRHYQASSALQERLEKAQSEGIEAAKLTFVVKDRKKKEDVTEFAAMSAINAYNGVLPNFPAFLEKCLYEDETVVQELIRMTGAAFKLEANSNTIHMHIASLLEASDTFSGTKDMAERQQNHDNSRKAIMAENPTDNLGMEIANHISTQMVKGLRIVIKELLACLATAYHQQKLSQATLSTIKQRVAELVKVSNATFKPNPWVDVVYSSSSPA